jgi:outer membrane protein
MIKLKYNLLFLVLIILSSCQQNKIGVVDLDKVFNEFEYKKVMEEKYKKSDLQRKRILDSIEIQIVTIERNYKINNQNISVTAGQELQTMRNELENKRLEFNEDSKFQMNEYNKLIIERMTDYIKQYGEQHQYDYIGAKTAENSVLFYSKKIDVTNEITAFINNKFIGK